MMQPHTEHPCGLGDREFDALFDMVVLNDLDRYHLVRDVADRVPAAADCADLLRAMVSGKFAGAHRVHHALRGGLARGARLALAG